MDGLNLHLLIGTVGSDAEVTNLPSGAKIAKFSVATNKTFKTKDGEKKTDTQWHDIECWSTTANVAENWVKKGTNLFILGEVKNDSWEDKDTGVRKYKTKIIANKITLLPGNKPTAAGAPVANPGTVAAEVAGAVAGAAAQAAVTTPPAQAQAQTAAYTQADMAATQTDDLPF